MKDGTGGVLITGGTGLVGSRLLRALSVEVSQRPVFVASRGKLPSDDRSAPLHRHWHVDLNDPITLPRNLHTVIHIAGEKRDAQRMWGVNHRGTERLLEAAAKSGVHRFVYLSSVGVYGAHKHAGLVDESHARTPNNVYEASKNAGETVVQEVCTRLGMEFVVVQPSNVLGYLPGRVYPLMGLMSTIKSGRFAFFGANDVWVNYIDVDDVAAAIAVATRSGRHGATYIVNTPARLADLVGWVAQALGVSVPDRHVPTWVGAWAGSAGSAYQRISGRHAPFNSERYLELTNTTRYEGDALHRELGFDYPVGIEAAVRRLVLAYRGERRL